MAFGYKDKLLDGKTCLGKGSTGCNFNTESDGNILLNFIFLIFSSQLQVLEDNATNLNAQIQPVRPRHTIFSVNLLYKCSYDFPQLMLDKRVKTMLNFGLTDICFH